MSEKLKDEELAPVDSTNKPPYRSLSVVSTQDAVFGEITEAGPNYRNVRIPDVTIHCTN